MTCVCACHVGGAWRPPCDAAGGCGSQHTAKPASLCQYADCDRLPFTGQTLCGKHYAALNHAVADAWAAWRWLGAQLGAAGGGPDGPRISGTREQPLPIRADYAEHRRLIRSTVDQWARRVAAESDTGGPFAAAVGAGQQWTPLGPADPLDQVCRWLVLRLPWVARQQWAPAMLADLDGANRRAWRLAPRGGRPMTRKPLPCPACERVSLAYFWDTGMIECRSRDCPKQMSLALYRQFTITAAAKAGAAANAAAEPGPVVAA